MDNGEGKKCSPRRRWTDEKIYALGWIMVREKTWPREKMCPWGCTMAKEKVGLGLKMGSKKKKIP
jgi:hypothetical protein